MFVKKNIISLLIVSVVFALACTKDDAARQSDSPDTGKGGSLARFTITANRLYIAEYNAINVYDLTDPTSPVFRKTVQIGWGVETIFPYQDKLFIGSFDGMYIYSLQDPDNPVKLGEARHVRSCDPVVANDTVAYVTLRGNSACGPAQDGLYIYDIKNVTQPIQKSLLPLSTPGGLGLKDHVVFICRGALGMTLVDVKDPAKPKEMYTVRDASYKDVIPYDDLLLCFVENGLLVYDTKDLDHIKKIGGVQY